MTHEDAALERARQHVKDVRDFAYHLVTYVVICALLVILDRRVDGGGGVFGLDWAYWVILFWGLGLAGHGISVFFGEQRVQRVYDRQRE